MAPQMVRGQRELQHQEVQRFKQTPSAALSAYFEDLTDPRRRAPTYPLINIVTIAICAAICGCDDFVSMAEYGRRKQDFFAGVLDLSAGSPSHDRFNAIFAARGQSESKVVVRRHPSVL